MKNYLTDELDNLVYAEAGQQADNVARQADNVVAKEAAEEVLGGFGDDFIDISDDF